MPRFSYKIPGVTTNLRYRSVAKTGSIVDIKPYNRRPSTPIVDMDS